MFLVGCNPAPLHIEGFQFPPTLESTPGAGSTNDPGTTPTGTGTTPPPPRIKNSFMVVHCDPVSSGEKFSQDYELLVDLVNTANSYQFKLAIHFSLSFAKYANEKGKGSEIKGWLAKGHTFGTHSHPEWLDEAGNIEVREWADLPKERVKQSISEATDAVNTLVGAENNKTLDTVAYFYSEAGSASDLIPSQFTTLAYGNIGYPYRLPVVLSDQRHLAAYFYRGIPGLAAENSLQVTAQELVREAAIYEGELLAPVIHPTNFVDGPVKTETINWMKWVQKNMKSTSPVGMDSVTFDLTKTNPFYLTNDSTIETIGSADVQKITVTVDPKTDYSNIEVVSYLSSGFRNLDLSTVQPAGFIYDEEWGRITWPKQSFSGSTQKQYTYQAKLTSSKAENFHVTALSIHSFLRAEGAQQSVQYPLRRWSMDNEVGTLQAQGKKITHIDSIEQSN